MATQAWFMLNIYVYVTHICGDTKYYLGFTEYGNTKYGNTKYYVGATEYGDTQDGDTKYYVGDTKEFDDDTHTNMTVIYIKHILVTNNIDALVVNTQICFCLKLH